MAGDDTLTTLLIAGAVIGTGGAALAAAPALAGTAFAASAGTLSTIGTVASVGLVGAGVQAQRRASQEAKVQIEEQREQERTAFALQEEQRERELAGILSSQTAMFGARGISLGSGAPQVAAEQSMSAATRESRSGSLGLQFRDSGLSSSARAESQRSRAAITGGVTQGISLLT